MEAVVPLKKFYELNSDVQVLKTKYHHLNSETETVKTCLELLKEASHETAVRLTAIEKDVKSTNNILLWILGVVTTIGTGVAISLILKVWS